MERDIQQNNAIDIHQNYFQKKIDDEHESFHVKTINLYSNRNHMVNHISWQPDGQRKMAVSYSNTIDSFVWDIGIDLLASYREFSFRWLIENPNQPEIILKSNSSLNTVEFNPKDTNQILAGCHNGQVCKENFRTGLT